MSPQGPPWEETGELGLCLVCVCLQEWGPMPQGEPGWWQRGVSLLPRCPLILSSCGQSPGVSFACAQLQLVPCRRENGCLPSFLGSVLCLCVCPSVPIPHPPCRAWGSLRVCGTGPLPIPSLVFISHCTTGTVMPNKTAIGSSGVAVLGSLCGAGRRGARWGHGGALRSLSAAAPARPGQRSARRQRHLRARRERPRR